MPINVNFDGLNPTQVASLQSYLPILDGIVNNLTALSERLDAGTPTGSRRAITAQATELVGPGFAEHVVKTIQSNAGEDPLRILGFVKTMYKAVDEAFAKTIKAFVDSKIEEMEAGLDTSVEKLSDEDRAALVAEYSSNRQQLEMFFKVLALIDEGPRVAAAIPEFKLRKISSGKRTPSGPRIGGFEFVINGSVVAKNFPGLASYLKSFGMEDATALSLKREVAVHNNVDPDDDVAFKSLFHKLAKESSFSWPMDDGHGGRVVVIARAATEVDTAASDDDEDDDEDDTSESE